MTRLILKRQQHGRSSLATAALSLGLCAIACAAPEVPESWSSDLPRPPIDLQMRWQVLRNHAQMPGADLPPDTIVIQDALKISAETGAMLGEDPLLRRSAWSDIDHMLRSARADELLALRDLQERSAGLMAGDIRSAGNETEALWLFRAYPWARSAHEVMLTYGEDALRAGRRHWAERAFQDVLTHANDPELLDMATLGYWLALAGQPNRQQDLAHAMSDVPDDTALPWRGAMTLAAEIKAAICSPVTADDGPRPTPLSDLRREKIQLTAAMADVEPFAPSQTSTTYGLGPWTLRRIEVVGDRVFVTGSRHLACYDVSLQKNVWHCDEPLLSDNAVIEERPAMLGRSWSSVVGGHVGSASGGAAIYRLTAKSRDGVRTHNVTARDSDSGKVLWSTSTKDEWAALRPQSEAIAGEGCAYVLAAGNRSGRSPSIYLVCLDSVDGAIVWKRILGELPENNDLRDLALGGSAITLHEGAIYVATDTGLFARCDVRDGTLEWVRAYVSEVMQRSTTNLFRRDGTPPLVSGGRAFIAPRDHNGLLAVDAETGQLLWERTAVPSDRMVGIAGHVLIAQGTDGLAAFDLVSGADAWSHRIDKARAPRAVLSGNDVRVVSGEQLIRLRADTGEQVDALNLNGAEGSHFALLADGTIAEFVEAPMAQPVEQPGTVAGALRLPLALQWTLPCERPLLARGPDTGAGTNSFAALSGRLLFCVETHPKGRVLWQSRQKVRPNSLGFHGKLLIAARDRQLTALNARQGVTEWVLNLPFRTDIVGGDERMLFAGEASEAGLLAAIDPDTGTVIWQQSLGEGQRLQGGRVEWIAFSADANDEQSLRIYWSHANFENDGRRPAELVLDATSGELKAIKRFLPGEPQWPRQIAFSEQRAYGRLRRRPPWADHGPLLAAAMTYVGQGNKAHFARLTHGENLWSGLNLRMDVQPESQYWSSVGLHPTSEGLFVTRMGKLAAFDPTSAEGTVYALPRNPADRSAFNVLDFRATKNALMVISGSDSALPQSTRGSNTNALSRKTQIFADLFDRATGQIRDTQSLPGASAKATSYALQARLLEGGLLTTDAQGIYYLRSAQ